LGRWGGPSHSTSALLVVLGALALVGCGEGVGVEEGAVVRVYAAAALCAEAEHVAAGQQNRAGDVRVRVVCLPRAESRGRLDLAEIGTNARRATQDSAAIGYIGEPTAAATRFSAPILESAEVPQLPGGSGAASMSMLLHAIEEAGTSGSLRQSVYDDLK
jgi:hypothetical protein